MSDFSKIKWVMIRLFIYLIILGSVTIMFPKIMIWTGVAHFVLAMTELVFFLYVPKQKRVVDMPLELEDYTDQDDKFK